MASGGRRIVLWIPVSGPSVLPLSPLRHPLLVMPRLLSPWMSMTTGPSPRRSIRRMIPRCLRLPHRLPVVAVAVVRRLLLTRTPSDGADAGDGLVQFADVPPHMAPSAGVEPEALQPDGSFRLRLPDPKRSAVHKVIAFHGLEPQTSFGGGLLSNGSPRNGMMSLALMGLTAMSTMLSPSKGAPASRLQMRSVSYP